MIKDRLETLQMVQNTINGSNNVTVEIFDGQNAVCADPFLLDVEEIYEILENMRNNVLEVKKKYSAMLTTPHNDQKMKQEVESLAAEIKKNSGRVRVKLKRIELEIAERAGMEKPSADLRMKTIQNTTLTRKFVEIMTEYNLTQVDYRDRCKARIKRQLELTGRQTTDEELEEMLEQDNPAVFTQGIVTAGPDLRKRYADIEARHADIIKLENSIRELHDIFTDVALLVEGQGELVDRVEYHVERTCEYVEFGRMEMRKAHVLRNRSFKKRVWVFAGVVVLLLCLVLIGKFS